MSGNSTCDSQAGHNIDGRIDLMRIVEAAFFTPMGTLFSTDDSESWGLPMYFQGPPGSSKTAKFYQFARKWGIPFESLKPGSRGEGFFGCTPSLGDEPGVGRVLDFPLPRKFIKKFTTGPGLVFVDEATNTPPVVKPAILGFIQERELGEAKFSGRARVMAAGNAVEECASGYDFTLPEANRMGHIQWQDPTVDEFISYLTLGNQLKTEEARGVALVDAREAQVIQEFYRDAYPRAIGAVGGFLQRRSNLLRVQPKASEAAASGAWPSPRTWEYLTRALASSMVHRLDAQTTDVFLAAFVGRSVGNEFSAWRRDADLPLPADVLDGKVKFVHVPARLDRTAAVLHSCVSFMAQKRDVLVDAKLQAEAVALHRERTKGLWNFIGLMQETAADIAIPVMSTLYKSALCSVPRAKEVAEKLTQVDTAASA